MVFVTLSLLIAVLVSGVDSTGFNNAIFRRIKTTFCIGISSAIVGASIDSPRIAVSFANNRMRELSIFSHNIPSTRASLQLLEQLMQVNIIQSK